MAERQTDVLEYQGNYLPSKLYRELRESGIPCLGVTATETDGEVTAVQVICRPDADRPLVDEVVARHDSTTSSALPARRQSRSVGSFPTIRRILFALLALGAASVIADIVFNVFDSWAPNIATEAASIAITIGVIDQILRRQEHQRLQPRIDRAVAILSSALVEFSMHAESDYLMTHSDGLPSIRFDALEKLDLWLGGYGTEDNPRPVGPNGYARFIDECLEFVEKTRPIADGDRDVLPTTLVVALDNLNATFGGLGPSFAVLVGAPASVRPPEGWILLTFMHPARDLATALRGLSSNPAVTGE